MIDIAPANDGRSAEPWTDAPAGDCSTAGPAVRSRLRLLPEAQGRELGQKCGARTIELSEAEFAEAIGAKHNLGLERLRKKSDSGLFRTSASRRRQSPDHYSQGLYRHDSTGCGETARR